jgi:hypothetical protein
MALDECANDDVDPRAALLNRFQRDPYVPRGNSRGFQQARDLLLGGWVSDVSTTKAH